LSAIAVPPSTLRRLLQLLALAAALAAPGAGLRAADRKPFDLPAADAERALRQFSAQAGIALVFPSEITRGIHTRPVRGTYTPREALDRLLRQTGLIAIEDPKTGALSLARLAAPPGRKEPPTTLSEPSKKNTETMKTPAKPTRLAAALAVLFASQVNAQTGTTDTPKKEEAIVLSPFTISTEKDTGYQAADSLAGGRISTNVMKTPADQTILTREFLDDIAADNYIDAGRWLTGANMDRPSGGSDFGQGVVFRGVSPAGYPYRNYFRSLGPADDYIVERLDSARGPNSLIFADGVIGGIINTNTKRAQFGRPRTDLRLRFNSEGSIRGAIDVNRRLTDSLAARINLVAENEKRYNLFQQNRRGAHLAVGYRPWAKSEIRLEAEAQDLKFWGSTTSRFTDQVSSWNGITTATGPLTTNPGNGVSRLTTSKVSYGTAFETSGPLDFLNFGQTAGSGIGLTQTERTFNVLLPRLDRTFQFITPNKPSLQRQVAIGIFFEKEVNDRFAFEIAAHRSRQDRTNEPNGGTGNYWIDVNTVLPNGAANSRFGQAYTETNADQSSGDNRNTDYRAAAVYTFPFKSFSQRVNVLAGWREEDFIAVTDRYSRSNGTNPDLRNGANLTILRRYVSDGAKQNLVRPTSGQNGYNFDWVRTQDRFQKQELRNIQLATVGSYFADRLNVIAGIGYYDYKQYQKDILTVGANGKPTTIGYSAITEPVSTVRSSIGGVYFPVKQLGVYANASSSFTPVTSGDPGLDGKQFDPTDGQGYGVGLRANFLGGRLTGSVGYYDSSEKNRVTQFSSGEINSNWNALNKSEKNIPTANYRDRLDYKATGYEAELTANLGKGLRVFANVAFPKTSQTNTINGTRAYYAANIAEWLAGAVDPNLTPAQRTTMTNNNTALKARLDNAAEDRALNGTQKYTLNLFANYGFQSAPLKGLRVGGGANFVGRRLIGNQLNLPFDYYYGEARSIFTATSSYDFKVRNRPVTLQLNVSNLLDHERPIFTNAVTNVITNNRAVGQGYYYENPRTFTLTATIRF
jgi:iron complex outermembrane recepter protein